MDEGEIDYKHIAEAASHEKIIELEILTVLIEIRDILKEQ